MRLNTKKFLLLIGTVLVILLSSCGNKGNVDKLIDPDKYGSVIPDASPSTMLSEDDSAKAKYQMQLPEDDVLGYAIENGFFVNHEFSFYVHPLWRDNFVMEQEDKGSSTIFLYTYNFYYIEHETDIAVKLLRIDVMETDLVDQIGTGGKAEIGRSRDGLHTYFRAEIAVDPPDEFRSGEDLLEIYTSLLLPEKLQFDVNT